jgi:hypothetical protein
MVDWKLYIDSPQKRALYACGGSLTEGTGDGDGYGDIGGDGYGDIGGYGYGWGNGDGYGGGSGADAYSWGNGGGRSAKIW